VKDRFKTVVRKQNILKEPLTIAPAKIFRSIKYPATSGELAAYFSPNPGNGKKHPAINVATYGQDSGFLPFDISNQQEVKLRSPIHWLFSIDSPTWVFEGAKQGNIADLRSMAKETYSARVNFIEVKNTDHFGILAPTNEIIAKKILKDTGKDSNISFIEAEVNQAFPR
jgi:hypothetical protein